MKKLLFLPFLICLLHIANAQDKWQWVKHGGSTIPNFDEMVKDLAVDDSGNIYVTGYIMGNSRFDSLSLVSNGLTDIFVGKYNCQGNIEWMHLIGGAYFENLGGLALDSEGNIIINVLFSGNPAKVVDSVLNNNDASALIKFNNKGEVLWIHQNTFHFPFDVAVDKHNNIYSITGVIGRPYAPGYPADTGWLLAKHAPDKSILWVKKIVGKNYNTPGFQAITTDNEDNIYIAGYFVDSVRFGNITLKRRQSGFVAKFDNNGDCLWAVNTESKSVEMAWDISVKGNHLYMVGLTSDSFRVKNNLLTFNQGYENMFLVKFDLNGNPIWSKISNTTFAADGKSVTTDKKGEIIYVTGFFKGSIGFDSTQLASKVGLVDGYVAKFDSAGNFISAATLASTGEYVDIPKKIGVDSAGNTYVGGQFKGTMYYGDNSNTNVNSYGGSIDMFLAKYGNDICADTSNTSISEMVLAVQDIYLYPNPAKTGFYITTNNQWQLAEVYDPLGRLVAHQVFENKTAYINLINSNSGIYIVILRKGNDTAVRKLMVVE